jgi:GT2 family glycosyltransferase
MVDNGSADGSAEAAARRFPRVEVVALARNAGAAARNAGVRRARTPYVAFSDDDSWWQPGALRRAAAALDADPRLGLVAARTLVGPGCEPDPVNEAMAASPLREGGGAAVLGFLACACVVRKAAFVGVGGFSELLFFVGEERLLAYDLAAAERAQAERTRTGGGHDGDPAGGRPADDRGPDHP